MLILISMDVQYLQNVFNFKKRPNGQNHASLGSQHPIRKFPTKISNPPRGGGGVFHPLMLLGKPLISHVKRLSLPHFAVDQVLSKQCQQKY